jgi:2-oxo-4-hydroxy-4-carboxy--5-ureidoimidazoline (OHCU) decarboxylase
MARAMAGGSETAKRALIAAHPDLAGRLALAEIDEIAAARIRDIMP